MKNFLTIDIDMLEFSDYMKIDSIRYAEVEIEPKIEFSKDEIDSLIYRLEEWKKTGKIEDISLFTTLEFFKAKLRGDL